MPPQIKGGYTEDETGVVSRGHIVKGVYVMEFGFVHWEVED